jgi:acyl-CoA thioesterase-2
VDAKEFLGMSRRDESVWTFNVTERLVTPRKFLFGGCGLAAGIVALEEASGRPTIWASAQYLSYAMFESEVTVTTQLAVIGNNVTQARASAVSEGREILTVNAALGTGELSAPSPLTMPNVPGPDECPPIERPFDIDGSVFQYLESRVARRNPQVGVEGAHFAWPPAIWSRIPGHVDPCAATLAIFGDYVAGGVSQLVGQPMMGRSLDNTIRVAALEPTEWVLCEINMHALAGGFAHGNGFLWSQSGTLLATASQSIAAKLWTEWSPESN